MTLGQVGQERQAAGSVELDWRVNLFDIGFSSFSSLSFLAASNDASS